MRHARNALVGLLVAAGLAAMAPAAGAVVLHSANGHRWGVLLRPGGPVPNGLARQSSSASSSTSSVDLSAHGGGVLATSDAYLVFWGPQTSFSTASENLISQYLQDVARDSSETDDVYGVLKQYGSAAQGQTFDPSQQVIHDTTAYPPLDSKCAVKSPFTYC